MEEIIKSILSRFQDDPINIVIAGGFLLFAFLFMLKKLAKIAMFFVVLALLYLAYLFMTDPDGVKAVKAKLDKGKASIEKIDEAAEDAREDVDKIIEELEQKREGLAKKGKQAIKEK